MIATGHESSWLARPRHHASSSRLDDDHSGLTSALRSLASRLSGSSVNSPPARTLWIHGATTPPPLAEHPAFRTSRPRHVPIVITQELIDSVRQCPPDSPNSLPHYDQAPPCPPPRLPHRPRHIPIVIPSFALPEALLSSNFQGNSLRPISIPPIRPLSIPLLSTAPSTLSSTLPSNLPSTSSLSTPLLRTALQTSPSRTPPKTPPSTPPPELPLPIIAPLKIPSKVPLKTTLHIQATTYSTPLSLSMSRPGTGKSQASNWDSDYSGPSPNRNDDGRFQSTTSAYLSGENSSDSSLNHESPDVESRPGEQRDELTSAGKATNSASTSASTTAPISRTSDPAKLPQSASASEKTQTATTNLSGLVCNVHRCTGKEPHALVGATTTILGDKLYVFGGRRLSKHRPALTADLYKLDLIRRHWTKIEARGSLPSPRYFHSVCALGDSKLVCYGGMSPAKSQSQPAGSVDQQPEVIVMSDIHIYDTITRMWTHIPSIDNHPQGRYAHCATILPSSAIFTSTQAPLSAMQHNPPSANPNQGSIGVALDGTGGAEMVVVGGQDSANHYIEQISVFNLRSLKWTTTTSLGRSCGAYRSVIAPLTSMPPSKLGAPPGARIESAAKDGNDGHATLIYSNYNFLNVKLELQVRLADGSLVEKVMQGQFSPPGLRFPNGGVLDRHFVVSGTYLTTSKQEYALWALDLRSLTWSRIDAGGSVFSTGSWNRGVLWPRRNTFVILGNRRRNLVDDYNHRRINFTNVCMVELEAFGLYDNPRRAQPTAAYISASAPALPPALRSKHAWLAGGRSHHPAARELGRTALALRELADMDLLSISGERIPANSHVLALRWGPAFVQLMREGAAATAAATATTIEMNDAGAKALSSAAAETLSPSDHSTLRPGSTIASRNSTITITPSITTNHSSASTLVPGISSSSTANGISSTPDLHTVQYHAPTPTALAPTTRARTLYLPHTTPTIHALLHFLYTSALPPTGSPLATPQVVCSLLQLARPYRIDGLLEAVLARLHALLDGRTAAAVFNAAAMAAGGGRATGAAIIVAAAADGPGEDELIAESGTLRSNDGGSQTASDSSAGGQHGASGSSITDDSGRRGSATDDESDESSIDGRPREVGTPGEDDEVWAGGRSAVIGLQKRGLRGLMEGRRARERGRSDA